MDRQRLLKEKAAEIERLTTLSLTEIAPSRRDFTMFAATQKDGIALIPRVQRVDPALGGAWPALDVVAFARACDDAEAAAIAVATSALYGGSIEDLRQVAAAVTAPILRDDLCLHPNQLYQARLFGADAVVLPAADLPFDRLSDLVRTAQSMHMAPVIEVTAKAQLESALALAPACIGLRACRADGWADLDATRALAERIPPSCTVILLAEVADLGELLRTFAGAIDSAVVGKSLLDAADAAATIEEFLRST